MFENNEKEAAKAKKSELTRKRLYQAAVKLFTKQGFDQSSMRAIAKEAGVAVGASYYYYPSKESIVYDYYLKMHEDHLVFLGEFLQNEKDFAKRLSHVVKSKIEVAMPEKDMARALYRVAANPDSPLSPFSEANRKLVQEVIKVFEDVVEGSKDNFHPQIKKILPQYLWLYLMGVILFWIYDSSKESEKTFQLIDKTIPLIAYFNKQIQSPLAMPVRNKVINILKSFALNMGAEKEIL